jgi:hypothetical protein
MAINRSAEPRPVSVAEAQLTRVAGEGCAHHSHVNALLEAVGPHSARDLSDAVHLLCNLHGHYPGLIQIALERSPQGSTHSWLQHAADSFERERLYLVRLTSAVGPLPSTTGAAETEASLVAARHALETLATSERTGCALGAATALVGDWWPIRRLLDRAATRAGLDCPPPSLPDEASVVAAIDEVSANPSSARALAFGAEQLLLQHRALFDILEARAAARGDY